MVELNHVSKMFGNKTVVNDISFTINEGDIFGFLGPNGAGKTTTIKMMIGLLEPTKGEIIINNKNVVKDKKHIYEDIGVVFELPNLYMKATIKSNLLMFADIYQVPHTRVYEIMEELQLLDKKDIKVEKLSKGWKQRVLIGRALLHNPKLLILDEPTSGLDPNTTVLIREYIKKLNHNGTTIIITTHDMNEADELCNRIGIIDHGDLKVIGSPNELKTQYEKNKIFVEYMEKDEVKTISYLSFDKNAKEQLIQLIQEDKLISINQNEVTLGDVFFEVTGGELS